MKFNTIKYILKPGKGMVTNAVTNMVIIKGFDTGK